MLLYMSGHFRDLNPIELPPDSSIEQLKLELGDTVKDLADTIDIAGFDSESTAYVFEDPETLGSLVLPADFASFLIGEASTIKAVKACYESDSGQVRPRVAVLLSLENGEQIEVERDPSNLRTTDFNATYTTEPSESHAITSKDIGYLLSSLVIPRSRRPDLDIASLLTSHDPHSAIDPTDPVIAHYITQLLEIHADSWQREESTTIEFEDDKNLLRVAKTTGSMGTRGYVACLLESGSDRSPDDSFEITAKLFLFPGESTHQANVDYVRYWDSGTKESGSADQHPHMIDYLRAAIDAGKKTLEHPITLESYEALAVRTISKERLRRSAEDEQED